MRPAPLLLAASLAACSTLSRRLESEERAFLEASCALATAADVRVERGVLPAVPADAPTDDWRASDATVRIDADRAGASIAGQPVPLEALESTLAAATASPGAEIVLVIAADTPAWVWQPVVRAVSLRQDLPPPRVALERRASDPRTPPDPGVAEQLVQSRRAILERIDDPYVQQTALDQLYSSVGVPRGDCGAVLAELRVPVRPRDPCAERVAQARESLSACGLDRRERTRASTVLGARWHSFGRALVVTTPIRADDLLPHSLVFEEALLATAPVSTPSPP